MNNLIDLQDPPIKIRHSPKKLTSKKLLIAMLSVSIVVAMIAWLTFLSWGLFETIRAVIRFF